VVQPQPPAPMEWSTRTRRTAADFRRNIRNQPRRTLVSGVGGYFTYGTARGYESLFVFAKGLWSLAAPAGERSTKRVRSRPAGKRTYSGPPERFPARVAAETCAAAADGRTRKRRRWSCFRSGQRRRQLRTYLRTDLACSPCGGDHSPPGRREPAPPEHPGEEGREWTLRRHQPTQSTPLPAQNAVNGG
jgi:hypothetical protein